MNTSVLALLLVAGAAWMMLRQSQPTQWTPVRTQPPGSPPPALPPNPLDAIAASTSIAGLIGAAAMAVIHKFRGGEEGIYVNPARDEFKLQFAQFAPPSAPRDSNGPGFYGLAWLMHELGRDDLTHAFNQADSVAEFQRAVSGIAKVITDQATKVQELSVYAKAHGFGS